jgi:hypothetical protein
VPIIYPREAAALAGVHFSNSFSPRQQQLFLAWKNFELKNKAQ